MNKENCALKLVDEIILYYDARSKKHQIALISSSARYSCQIVMKLEFPRHIFDNTQISNIMK